MVVLECACCTNDFVPKKLEDGKWEPPRMTFKPVSPYGKFGLVTLYFCCEICKEVFTGLILENFMYLFTDNLT